MEIWTCLKFQSRDLFLHKLALLTMQVQKYGETSHMIQEVTFGLLDVWYTSSPHSDLLSQHLICKVFTNEWLKEYILKFLQFTQKNFKLWLAFAYKLAQQKDQKLTSYFHINFWMSKRSRKRRSQISILLQKACSKQSKIQETFV